MRIWFGGGWVSVRCLVIDGLVGWICIYLFIHWISGKVLIWTPRRGEGGERGGKIAQIDGVTAQGMVCRLELGSGA